MAGLLKQVRLRGTVKLPKTGLLGGADSQVLGGGAR